MTNSKMHKDYYLKLYIFCNYFVSPGGAPGKGLRTGRGSVPRRREKSKENAFSRIDKAAPG